MVWVMMTVVPFKRFHRHAQKAAGVPLGRSFLHQPSGAGVSHCMWNDFSDARSLQPGGFDSGPKGTLNVLHRSTSEGNNVFVARKARAPAQKVLPEALWYPRLRSLLGGAFAPNWIPVDQVVFEMNVVPSKRQNGPLSLARQQADAQEQC